MIFVTGCARSGTSLITRILAAHGCNLGKPINSLYENTAIREGILKPYLRAIGADPLGQRNLPDTDSLLPVHGLREKVSRLITGPGPKAYKDAKLTLVWPVFAAAFPEARWLIVRRNGERIVESCCRTPFMVGRTADGWRQWVVEHEHRFEAMKSALPFVIEVWTDSIVDAPWRFAPIAAALGLQFNLAATDGAIDKKAWHHDSAAPVL